MVKPIKKDLEEKVEKLSATVADIVTTLDKIVEKLKDSSPIAEFKAPDAKPSEYVPKGFVPQAYRRLCDEILSSEFGLDCIESDKSMDFTVNVIVPERFSSLTKVEKDAGVKDMRSKVISRALGENGVRDWLLAVRENLNKFYRASGVQSPFTNNTL